MKQPLFSAGQPVIYGWTSTVIRVINVSWCDKRFCWMYECVDIDGDVYLYPEMGLDSFRISDARKVLRRVA